MTTYKLIHIQDDSTITIETTDIKLLWELLFKAREVSNFADLKSYQTQTIAIPISEKISS